MASSALAIEAGAPVPWTLARNRTTEKANSDTAQLADEVVVSLGAWARHEADAQRDRGYRKALVATQEALALERMQKSCSPSRQSAQERRDIDVGWR